MRKINEGFVCINCKNNVKLAEKTCRNHCNFCFVSVHLDWDVPWDRQWNCKGIMYPIEYEIRNWKTKLHFKCEKCWKSHRNKTLSDDDLSNIDWLISKYKQIIF